MSAKKKTKTSIETEKNTLYELSSGLSVLFLPVLFCIAFVTGYSPSLAFPFLPHSVFMFLFIFCGIMTNFVQKKALKEKKPKATLDRLAYLSLFFLVLTVFSLLSTQFIS